jgi:hypothetical protein
MADTATVHGDETSTLQKAARLVGIVFLAVGILGFIPGITTNYGDMSFAGHNSDAELLGIFQVSILHNLVHLAFGIAGLVLSRTWDGARLFLVGGGIVYLLLGIYDALVKQESSANFLPTNNADAWLHIVLGLGMLALGLLLSRERDRVRAGYGDGRADAGRSDAGAVAGSRER